MKRVAWIDFSKATGIVMIIVAHSLFGKYAYLSNVLFAINVPIFFVLSGYLYRDKPYSKIIKGGWNNLLLPYLATSLVMALIMFFGNKFYDPFINNFQFGTKGVILAMLYGRGAGVTVLGYNVPAIGAIWFLLAMFFGNLLYSTLRKFDFSNENMTLIAIVISLAGFWIEKVFSFPWSINAALISIVFYWAGSLIKEYQLMEKITFSRIVISLLLWLSCAAAGTFYMNASYATNPILAIVGGIAGSYCVMMITKVVAPHLGRLSFYIEKYGQLSLIALCCHIVNLNCFNEFNVFKLMFNNTLAQSGAILLMFRLLFSIVGVVIIPKLPYLRTFYMYRQYPFSSWKRKPEN